MSKILLLNGPNLNLLGTREPEIYGSETLDDIVGHVRALVEGAELSLDSFQSNAEHELIDAIHAARDDVSFILINPGAFTHTSIAIRDALLSVDIPFIEIHLSNVSSREDFRQTSYLSDVAVGCISGLGAAGYIYAADYAVNMVRED